MHSTSQTQHSRSGSNQDREILLKHAKHPLRVGDTSLFARQGQCKNPLCGDLVSVGVELDGTMISKIQIQPTGCGISIASASLMTELIEGKPVAEALTLLRSFNEALLMTNDEAKRVSDWPEELKILKPLSQLRENPTKVPCALIGWFAFKDAVTLSTPSYPQD